MKGNKGITLIALIVTIIVLIILAGVAIAMLAGDNGIIDNATKARYDNAIASFDEKVKMAQMSMRTTITSKAVQISTDQYGYIATRESSFKELVKALKAELGVATVDDSSATKADREGFTVSYWDAKDDEANKIYGFLENEAEVDENEHIGYIFISYTDNSLRSSLPKKTAANAPKAGDTTFTSGNIKFNLVEYNPNAAAMVYVIKVSNYGCEMSLPSLTTTTKIDDALESLSSDSSDIEKYFVTSYTEPSGTPSPTN